MIEGTKKKINQENTKLKSRSSFNDLFFKMTLKTSNSFKKIGYYFPKIDTFIEELDEIK